MIKLITFTFLSLCGVISIVLIEYGLRKKTYCGTIKYKVESFHNSKHSITDDPILIVKFDSFTQDIHTDLDTFLSHKEGDIVCFDLVVEDNKNYFVIGFLTFIVSAFMALGLYIHWYG